MKNTKDVAYNAVLCDFTQSRPDQPTFNEFQAGEARLQPPKRL